MATDYEAYAAKFSVSHMSNAKWRKLFRCWVPSAVAVPYAEWCYIDSNHTAVIGLPQAHEILEARFADGRFQPVEYKWIRKIRIPYLYRPKADVGYHVQQDVAQLKVLASRQGHFPIFDVDGAIEVRGYE